MSYRRVRAAGAIAIAATLSGIVAAGASESARPEPVVTATDQFAFFSDFETNLNDALIAAGDARNRGKPELFRAGPEAACLAKLPDPEERRLVEIARGFRSAGAPAYRACRWAAQDQANRGWIDALLPLLAEHEAAIARRLSEVYQTPWGGLPFRVDVVETADWSGAHTINLLPTGAHVLISSSHPDYRGLAALEMIFHEASHFLTGRQKPLPAALAEATRKLGNPFHGDLAHAVNFYVTGEVVRRVLGEAGKPGYTPYLYAQGLFDRGTFRRAIESTWPPYLDGKRTLPEARPRPDPGAWRRDRGPAACRERGRPVTWLSPGAVADDRTRSERAGLGSEMSSGVC